MKNLKKKPVVLITGYLGSGKTTLLNNLLKQEKRRVTLIVNDMGSINVDAEILKKEGANVAECPMYELQNSCICCTLRDEFIKQLEKISEIDSVEVVFVEASGISDPGAVSASFLAYEDENPDTNVQLTSVVTVVDADRIYREFLSDLADIKNHREEMDEHVWLSLKNAQILTGAIASALSEVDSKNAEVYKKNLASYNARLSALDGKYVETVKAAGKNTLLFGDRFPFRYLVDDYGLKYYAAFAGCSAESEASFKTIAFLSEKVNELGLNSVCQIESGNGKIAKTVISNSKNKKAKVLTFDSLQSTTAKQIKKGATYFGAMEKNLEILKEALR